MSTIGVIGNGFVGSAIVAGFLLHVDEILIYDTDKSLCTHTLEETLNGADVIFVCVPTPMLTETGGRIDLTIMDSVFKTIDELNKRKDNIFVIKSTVVPGTTEKYQKLYPNLRIVFSPEFLTERAARLDFINASRIVLGGKEEDVNVVESLFKLRFPHKRMVKTDTGTAQLIKYMANCFFAVKISFMNEMKQICDALDLDWQDASEGFITDGRIGNSHLDVPGHDNQLGFGGKCFPKDLNAMIYKMEEAGVTPTVLQAAWDKNLEVRKFFDWADIQGAVTSKD
jgi:nucleotide sugar dehydrogenase